MKYILEGNEKAVQSVIRENRIRVNRGMIKFTPYADDEQPATEQPIVEGEQQGDDVIDDQDNASDDSKVVVEDDSKTIVEDDSKEVVDNDNKIIVEDDSKEVVEDDSKVVEEEPKNKKSKK